MGNPFRTLRRLLLIDATSCALMGAALVAAADPLASLIAIPSTLLFRAGLILLPIAAFMALLARQRPVPGWGVSLIVIGNLLWVFASLALPLSGSVSPNLLGWLFLLAQAAFVTLLTLLEHRAVPRMATA